eukprot:209283_1
MAEDATDKKKPKSKFGMIMNSVGRSAKKNLSRAGQQMASGAAKYKHVAVEKIAKVPTIPQDPQITTCLERLKDTKTEIYTISDTARNLYETTAIATATLYQLSQQLNNIKPLNSIGENEASFEAYSQKLSTNLSHLSAIKYQYLQNMEKQLVIPTETFSATDIEKVQKLKVKYKNCKTHFDVVAHKLTKVEASSSKTQTKIDSAKQKKDLAYKELTDMRNEIKTKVNNLEQNKNENLLNHIDEYWIGYLAYVNAQNDLVTGNINGLMMAMNNVFGDDEKKNEMIQSIAEQYDNVPDIENEVDNEVNNEVINEKQLLEPVDEQVENEEHVNDEEYNDENENEIIDENGYNPFDEKFLPNSQNDL